MASSNFIALIFSSLLCSTALRCFEVSGTTAAARAGDLQDFSSQGPLEASLNSQNENHVLDGYDKKVIPSNFENETFDAPHQNVSEKIGRDPESKIQTRLRRARPNYANEGRQGRFVKNIQTYRQKFQVPVQIPSNSTLKFNFGSPGDYSSKNSSNISESSRILQQELNSFGLFHGDPSIFSTKKNKVGMPFIQSVLGSIIERVLEIAVHINGILLNFPAVPLQPELLEGSVSPMILDWLHSIGTNFQNYSDSFVLNFFVTWMDFLNNEVLEARSESVKYAIDFLNDADVCMKNFEENLASRISLNDVFDYVRDRLTLLHRYIGPLSYDLHGNQTRFEYILFEKILTQVCKSSALDGKVTAMISETLYKTLLFTEAFLDSCVENIDISSIVSFFDQEMMHQIVELACFYTVELPDIKMGSPVTTKEKKLLNASVDFSRQQGRMFQEWYKYFDIYFLAERLKELPFMSIDWDLQAMLESVRKSIRAAWLVLLQSDPKDIAVSLYGDLLPRPNNSEITLRLKCVELLGELQDFQNSQAADMEELIRTLLRGATELQCFNLGAADPVLQRLQFLLSMLRVRRSVILNPFDPLNVSRRHMAAVEPPEHTRQN